MSASTEGADVVPSEVLHGRVVRDSSAYAAVARDAIRQLIEHAMIPVDVIEDVWIRDITTLRDR
jgi:hypothetical protein